MRGLFRIRTHRRTSHEKSPPNSQHVRTHMNLFLPRSYVSEFGVILNERPRALHLSHLHKTRPNYLHIRPFCIYSEQTRSRQIFEHPSVPFSPVQTHKKLSYRPLGSQLYIRLIQRNLAAEQNATFLTLSLYDEMYDDKIKLYY